MQKKLPYLIDYFGENSGMFDRNLRQDFAIQTHFFKRKFMNKLIIVQSHGADGGIQSNDP